MTKQEKKEKMLKLYEANHKKRVERAVKDVAMKRKFMKGRSAA